MVIIADATANPDWIAADLLAQAEHDAAAQSILITPDAALAEAVAAAVEHQLATLPRARHRRGELARLRRHHPGREPRRGAVPLVDRLAPEHLEIMAADAEALADAIRNAGAIFLGGHTPEAIGDYVGGSNHVLPTARSARFSSGPRRARLHEADVDAADATPAALAALGPAAITLGRGGRAGRACPLGRDPRQPGDDGPRTRGAQEPAGRRRRSTRRSIGRGTADQEHERRIAIYDLLEENSFGSRTTRAAPII